MDLQIQRPPHSQRKVKFSRPQRTEKILFCSSATGVNPAANRNKFILPSMNKIFTILGLVLLIVAGAPSRKILARVFPAPYFLSALSHIFIGAFAQDDAAQGGDAENVDLSNVKPEDLQQELLQQAAVLSSPDIETHAVLPDYPEKRSCACDSFLSAPVVCADARGGFSPFHQIASRGSALPLRFILSFIFAS